MDMSVCLTRRSQLAGAFNMMRLASVASELPPASAGRAQLPVRQTAIRKLYCYRALRARSTISRTKAPFASV